MKFFIPHADDKEQEERVYDSIRKWAVETTGNRVLDRRIYSISWRHEGRRYESSVGKPDGRLGEEVIAILEGEATYLVCTTNRGVARGMPMLVGKDEAFVVVDFEPE
jgi:hypothetical protein